MRITTQSLRNQIRSLTCKKNLKTEIQILGFFSSLTVPTTKQLRSKPRKQRKNSHKKRTWIWIKMARGLQQALLAEKRYESNADTVSPIARSGKWGSREKKRRKEKKKTKTLEFNYSPSLPPLQITMERRNRARERKGRNDRDRVILYFEQPRFFFPFSVLTAVKDSPSVCFFPYYR